MRALRFSLLALVVLLVVGDRVGAVVAGRMIATRLQTAGSLSTKPHVSIRGFPFLTQAISGRYDRIDLSVDHLERRSVGLERFAVTVKGARVPLSEALRGQVASVPVEGLTATAVVTWSTIISRTGLVGATAQRSGRDVLVTGQAQGGGTVRSVTRPSVQGTTLHLGSLRIAIGTLPYGLRITGVSVASDGVVLTAATGPNVLRP